MSSPVKVKQNVFSTIHKDINPKMHSMIVNGQGEFTVSCVLPSSCKDALVSRQLPAERTAIPCIPVFEQHLFE